LPWASIQTLLKFCNPIKGERHPDGTYGFREGYAAYEYWKQGCLDFFTNCELFEIPIAQW